MTFAPGTRVGPYELLSVLGEGGMGTVYRAHDPRLLRDVAVKVLRSEVMADHDRQTRFLHEARAVSALKHPNIVTVYDVGTKGDVAYMVLELVEGRSLDQAIPRGGMPVADVLKIGVQIAEAFASAHAAQIIHRDLKPANVMLQQDGRVKVLDFGLAKLVDRSDAGAAKTATQTAAGMIMGSAAYMSPEQAEGKPLDARTDIFSFGALLYELCTGTRAFRGDSQVSVLSEVLRHDPPPVTTARPDLPPELARLVARCLRKDPARRVQSMADLKVALDDLREESNSGHLTVAPPARGVTRGLPQFAWLMAAAAIAVLAITMTMMWRRNASTPSPSDAPGEPVPLTSYPGRESTPAFSPDGSQIAFSWDGERENNVDVYVKSIGGGPPLRLTTDPRIDHRAKWSPDGRQLAFIRLLDRETFAVILVPPLGGPEKKLGQFFTRYTLVLPLASIAWTTDSKFLFVSGGLKAGDTNHIQRVSIETGEVQPFASAPAGANGFMSLAVAPDGQTLAAVLVGGVGSPTVSLLSLSPTWELRETRPLALGAPVDTVTFTADSRDLLVRIAVNVPLPLHRIAVSGGSLEAMAWVGPDAHGPTVSATGRRLAFARTYRDTNIWRIALDGPSSSTPAMRQITRSSFREVAPHYSRDGTRLAFHSNRSGSVQVWTSDADGGHPAQLTNMDQFATTGSPRWSPDGQKIVFDSNATGSYHVYQIGIDGGRPTALTTGSSSNFIATYAPDGAWVYFTSDRSGQSNIWRVPATGGEPEQVTRGGGQAPVISNDHVWLFFTKQDGAGGLWRRRVGGGDEQRLIDSIHRHNYAVTPAGVYFAAPVAADGTSSVRFFDFATGSLKDVVAIDKPADLGLAVSPDNRSLLFTKIDYAGTDLMLVENFR
jgi:serine/threonine protein kinase